MVYIYILDLSRLVYTSILQTSNVFIDSRLCQITPKKKERSISSRRCSGVRRKSLQERMHSLEVD